MLDMHTKQESVRLEDMIRSAELLIEIVRIHAENQLIIP
jgi:di/tripeptidase